MAALHTSAKISYLKGKAYRFKNNHFYLLNEYDNVSVGDVILTGYQAVMVLDFSNDGARGTKYLVPLDSVVVLSHEKIYDGFSTELLLSRIEHLAPTVNGESCGVSGVYSLALNNRGYRTSLMKSLSLAQVNTLQQLAKLSVQFSFGTKDKFSEDQILDAVIAQGGKPSRLMGVQQPLNGKIVQKSSSIFSYLPLDFYWDWDCFNCVILDEHQAPVSVSMLLRKGRYEALELQAMMSVPIVSNEWSDNQELMDVMGGELQHEELAQTSLSSGSNDSLWEENDNDLNFIELEEDQIIYEIWLKQADVSDSDYRIIDNFMPQDSILIRGLGDFEALTDYLRVSLRESEHGISTLIEVSHAGEITDNRVTQTLVIDQVDLIKGAANQEDVINQLIDSGTLSLDSNEQAA